MGLAAARIPTTCAVFLYGCVLVVRLAMRPVHPAACACVGLCGFLLFAS